MNHWIFGAAALAAAACAPPPESTATPGPAPTPAEWTRVHATGPFSVAMPASLTRSPAQGIDSAVDVFESPSMTLTFDYGMYSCGTPGPNPGETRGHATIGGRDFEIVRYRDNDERPVKLVAATRGAEQSGPGPHAPQMCLSVGAQCATDADCDTARAIIETIAFD